MAPPWHPMPPWDWPHYLLNQNAVDVVFADFAVAGGDDPAGVTRLLSNADISQRIIVETAHNGTSTWRFVPRAILVGVVDEGAWPRQVKVPHGYETLTRDFWDMCKLDPRLRCIIDHDGPSITHVNPNPIDPEEGRSAAHPVVVDDDEVAQSEDSPTTSGSPQPPRNRQSYGSTSSAPVDTESEGEDNVPAPTVPQPSPSFTPPTEPERAKLKRKASASPDGQRETKSRQYRERSPSIISVSSGSDTETPLRPRRRAKRPIPKWNYPHTAQETYTHIRFGSEYYNRSDNRQQRMASLRPNTSTHTTHHTAQRPNASGFSDDDDAEEDAVPPMPDFRRPTAPLRTSSRYRRSQSVPVSVSPSANGRTTGTSGACASGHVSDSEHGAKPQQGTASPGSTRASPTPGKKRRASQSPEVVEITNPSPETRAKRPRTQGREPTPGRHPDKKARRQRKAERDQLFREARPTANLNGEIPPFEDPWSQYHEFNPDAASQTREEHFTQGRSGSGFSNWREAGTDESDDDDKQRPDIDESRRKLAELERDRPIWEEAARRRKVEEEFAKNQAKLKAEREEQLRAQKAAREEAARHKQAEWARYQEKKAEEDARRAQHEYTRNTYGAYGRTQSGTYYSHSTNWEGFAGPSGSSKGSSRTYEYARAGQSDARTAYTQRNAHATVQQAWQPKQALECYNKLCAAFDGAKYTEDSVLKFSAIPWPVLERPPVRIADLDWDAVDKFFKSVKLLLTGHEYDTLVDKSHKRFHPDRWRARTGAYKYLEGSEDARKEVETKVNMVSQVITPLWAERNR